MTSYVARTIAGRILAGRVATAVVMLAAGAAQVCLAQDGGVPEDIAVGVALGVGVEHLPDDHGGLGATWQALTLAPDINFGKFSVGLAAKLRFRFDGGPTGSEWEIRDQDWSPDPAVPGRSFLDLILPIIRYARYGAEGEPLVVRIGSYDYATLGSGFVLGEYSNTRLLPERRLFGVDLDVDGAVFNLPVVGVEMVVGHVPAFDLMGARVWARPLNGLGLPLISSLQVGATAAADFAPFRYDPDPTDQVNVSALGLDVIVPIVATPAFSASTHGDVVFLGTSEADTRSIGTAVGISGRAIDILRYGLQLRLTDDRFLPIYFDGDYDRLRVEKYRALRRAEQASTQTDALEGLVHAGWAARIGTSLLDRRIEVDLGLSGPLTGERGALATVPYAQLSGLDVQGRVGVRNVGIEGISFGLDYRKRDLDSLADVIDPKHLSLGTALTYHVGSTVVTLSYRGYYDAVSDGLVGAPALESWIKLF